MPDKANSESTLASVVLAKRGGSFWVAGWVTGLRLILYGMPRMQTRVLILVATGRENPCGLVPIVLNLRAMRVLLRGSRSDRL